MSPAHALVLTLMLIASCASVQAHMEYRDMRILSSGDIGFIHALQVHRQAEEWSAMGFLVTRNQRGAENQWHIG
ncbi:MAG TPA: hypothetical protein VEG30_12640 [Terriglobales bacterium]|nr:hypothetical protein [Terriglobales bacterium]